MRVRVRGDARASLCGELRQKYEVDMSSIRALAEEYGLSYGLTRNLLTEAGTDMRPRGGNHAR